MLKAHRKKNIVNGHSVNNKRMQKASLKGNQVKQESWLGRRAVRRLGEALCR